jgi:hypothetical protein
MENIAITREGSKLLIEIDLARTSGPSASGKTLLVASTRGSKPVPGSQDTFLGLNCYRYATPRAEGKAARTS